MRNYIRARWRSPYDANQLATLADLKSQAEARGLHRGQPLRDATAICPGLLTVPADPPGEAQFLQRFVQDGVAWAHLDIAGVAWSIKGDSTTPKGATAYGVRLLDRLIADNYER